MKNSTWVVLGVFVLAAIVLGVVLYQNNTRVNPSNNTGYGSTSTVVSGSQSGGNVYVGVADATSDINNVNDIDMSIKKVELHSATQGWVTLSSTEKQYPLLSLHANGETELYTEMNNVPMDTYDKVRVTLGDTIVRTNVKGNLTATLPSSEIVINSPVKVVNNEDTNLKLDFLGDKSLHVTSDGMYVFAPVVNSEARSDASVNVGSDNSMNVSGGTVDSSASVGMDLNGSSIANFVLQTNNTLKINSNVSSTVEFVLGGKYYTADTSQDHEDEMNQDGTILNTNTVQSGGGLLNANTNVNMGTSVNTTNGSTGVNTNTNNTLNLGY